MAVIYVTDPAADANTNARACVVRELHNKLAAAEVKDLIPAEVMARVSAL